MKGTAIVIAIFALGCLAGWSGVVDMESMGKFRDEAPVYILYVLMFLVGISMGCNPEMKSIVKSVRPKILLLPLATIAGTLVLSAAVSLVISRWSLTDCLAVGSGMGYYSLSSVLISQYKEVSLGAQMAAELGTVALLTNVFREIFTLVSTPALNKWLGPFAPIASAGVTAIDVCLPVITRSTGDRMLPAAIVSGVVTDFSVPVLVTFFCSF